MTQARNIKAVFEAARATGQTTSRPVKDLRAKVSKVYKAETLGEQNKLAKEAREFAGTIRAAVEQKTERLPSKRWQRPGERPWTSSTGGSGSVSLRKSFCRR